MGVLVTILTSGIGLLWNKIRLEHVLAKRGNLVTEFYVVGLIAHIVMLMCELALPENIFLNVFQQTVVPILFIYPIVSLLLSLVLFNGFKNYQTSLELKESEARYKYLYHGCLQNI